MELRLRRFDEVDAFLERKWSQYEPDKPKSYLEPDKVTSQIERPSEETIQIVKDYCQYVHDTYGRFPAYLDPMYQRLTCQAQHVDTDFYAQIRANVAARNAEAERMREVSNE